MTTTRCLGKRPSFRSLVYCQLCFEPISSSRSLNPPFHLSYSCSCAQVSDCRYTFKASRLTLGAPIDCTSNAQFAPGHRAGSCVVQDPKGDIADHSHDVLAHTGYFCDSLATDELLP